MTMSGSTLKTLNSARSDFEDIKGSSAHITLYNDSGTWKVKDHTVTTPAFAAVGEVYYDPPLPVKGISISSLTDTVLTVQYQKKKAGVTFSDIVESLICNAIHPIRATRINLEATTTAVTIHLHC